MKEISFCVCPGSSGDTLGSYHHDTKQIYIDIRAIDYELDDGPEDDKFMRLLSQVINHEIIHKVLDEYVSIDASIKFDNLFIFKNREYLLGE
ncbi:MAG: hypothetical protein IMZ52_04680 [Actinobacteria bacterium]|nr:hypothetical protein [Actinomycetota bacterium]MBE3114760.1 hypothetical protein [Actinomycetota bacterium]